MKKSVIGILVISILVLSISANFISASWFSDILGKSITGNAIVDLGQPSITGYGTTQDFTGNGGSNECIQGKDCNFRLTAPIEGPMYYELWWNYNFADGTNETHCGAWTDKTKCTGIWSDSQSKFDAFYVTVEIGPLNNSNILFSQLLNNNKRFAKVTLWARTWQNQKDGWHSSPWTPGFIVKITQPDSTPSITSSCSGRNCTLNEGDSIMVLNQQIQINFINSSEVVLNFIDNQKNEVKTTTYLHAGDTFDINNIFFTINELNVQNYAGGVKAVKFTYSQTTSTQSIKNNSDLDITAPEIKDYSLTLDSSTNLASFSVTLDEQANCKWDAQDKNYNSLSNNLSCAFQNYAGGISSCYNSNPISFAIDIKQIYIRCQDNSGNTMLKSYVLPIDFSKNNSSSNIHICADTGGYTYQIESTNLKMVTEEDSVCRYSTESCEFDMSQKEGIEMPYTATKEHYAEWKNDQSYYIKCSATGSSSTTSPASYAGASTLPCSGCTSDSKCYPFGYRISNKFCKDDGNWALQSETDITCNNNFECSSNVCVGGKCISEGFLQSILNWFKKLFGI